MAWHIAPIIRERENARASAGLIQSYNSVGYTERSAQEGVTQPIPKILPHGGLGNLIFVGNVYTPTL